MYLDRIFVLFLVGVFCEEDILDEFWEGSLFDFDLELFWICVFDIDVVVVVFWLVDGGGGVVLVFVLVIVFVEVILFEVFRLGDCGKKFFFFFRKNLGGFSIDMFCFWVFWR